MPNLRKLDLSSNKFESLADLPALPMLESLNLENNKLASADCLPHLECYKQLQTLLMTGCPFVEELGDRFKNEVLIVLGVELTQLKRLGEEDEVAPEDIEAANAEREERAKQKREAEEEAARLAAEAAENPPAEAEAE